MTASGGGRNKGGTQRSSVASHHSPSHAATHSTLHQRLGLARSERYGATAGLMTLVDADSGVFCTGVLGSDSCSLSHPQDGVRASKERAVTDMWVLGLFLLTHSFTHQPTATEAPEIACMSRSRMAMNSGWDLTSRAGVPAR